MVYSHKIFILVFTYFLPSVLGVVDSSILKRRTNRTCVHLLSVVVFFFQSERREKHEEENARTLEEEVDRVKMEKEQEQAELQVRRKQIK